MHEFGIGRAANVAIASLPGFTLPGDVSGSDKYYREDLVEPPILATRGAIAVFPGARASASSRSPSGSKGTRRAATLTLMISRSVGGFYLPLRTAPHRPGRPQPSDRPRRTAMETADCSNELAMPRRARVPEP